MIKPSHGLINPIVTLVEQESLQSKVHAIMPFSVLSLINGHSLLDRVKRKMFDSLQEGTDFRRTLTFNGNFSWIISGRKLIGIVEVT